MHNHSLSARLAIAVCGWLLARAGVEWQLRPPRDKRGRFKPKDGGGYGLPREFPHHVADLMHDMGVSQQMYETAAVALVLPDDLEDVPALERCLRHWILLNMDHWVNGKGRGVWGVMQALMRTWANDLYRLKPPKRMWGKINRHDTMTPRSVGTGLALSAVGTQLAASVVEEVQFEPLNLDTCVGEDLVSSRSVEFGTADPRATGGGTTKDTKTTQFGCEPQCPPNLRDLRVLRGLRSESSSLDTSTTAGGRKTLPYSGQRGPPSPTLSTHPAH